MATYIVTGAGEPLANGNYVESGTANGKPIYFSPDCQLVWDGAKWIIEEIASGTDFYSNVGTGSTPPLTGWTTELAGTAPAPTLSLAGGFSGSTIAGEVPVCINKITTIFGGLQIPANARFQAPTPLSDDAVSYDLMQRHNTGSFVAVETGMVAGDTFDPPGLVVNDAYEWKWLAHAANGDTQESATTSTSDLYPAAPTATPTITPAIIFTAVCPTLTSGAARYCLQVKLSTDSAYSTSVFSNRVSAGETTTWPNPLSAGATYNARWVALNTDVFPTAAFTAVGPAATVAIPAAPTITSFTPTSGGAGTSVEITGTGFSDATAVKFNGVNATGFTVDSSTQITAVAPGLVSTGPISVTTPTGTATSGSPFTVDTPVQPSPPDIDVTGATTATVDTPNSFDASWDTLDFRYWKVSTPGMVTTLPVTAGVDINLSALSTSQPYLGAYRATNANGTTDSDATPFTPEAEVTEPPAAPAVPSHLTLTDLEDARAKYIVPALPANADTLRVRRKLASAADSTYVTVAFGLSGGETVQDSGLVASTEYAVKAVAVNAYGTKPGPVLYFKTEAFPPGASDIPDVPSAPTGYLLAPPAQVTILAPAWDEEPTHPTQSMELRRSDDDGATWTTVHTWTDPDGSYDDTDVLPLQTYLYSARGLNTEGASDWSASFSVTVQSGTLDIAILTPVEGATMSRVATVRFSLADAGTPNDICPLPLPQVFIGGLPTAAAPVIETPDPLTADDVEVRNTIYTCTVDTSLYPTGVTTLSVRAIGTDCLLAEASIAVTISNTLQTGVLFMDIAYDFPAPTGYRWGGAIASLENRALSDNLAQRWWQQWRLATDTSPAWPLDGVSLSDKEAEWALMQALSPLARQHYDASGTRIETTQYRADAPILDYPGQSLVWRLRWEPIEPDPSWFETLAGAASIVKIRNAGSGTTPTQKFLILARMNDDSAAGLYEFDGTDKAAPVLNTIIEPGVNIRDACIISDKVYAIIDDTTIQVYDRDSGQATLTIGIPDETRPFAFIEAVNGRPILLCVDSGLGADRTQAYNLTFAAPQALWSIDPAVTLTNVYSGTLGMAADDELWSSGLSTGGDEDAVTVGGITPPTLAHTFSGTITALHRAGVGLDDGHVWLQNAASGWYDAADIGATVNALGGWIGAAGRERATAGGDSNELFEQPSAGPAWILGRTLSPPAELTGTTIDSVTALAQWIYAGGDALLIGTGDSALLGVLQRSALGENDGAFKASVIFNENLDVLPVAV